MRTHLKKANKRFFLLWAFLFVCLFSINSFAQKSRPTPTPRTDIPQVVSRDEDDEIETEVNETTENNDSSNTLNLPKTNTTKTNESNDETSTKQKRMMMYLDLLTKTEQRAASLRQQVFDLLERTNTVTSKLKQLEYEMRPEVISASTALTGSLRPEDLREQRKQSLQIEKDNLQALLQQLESSRTGLENNLRNAELLVERVRVRFEVAVDEALNADENDF